MERDLRQHILDVSLALVAREGVKALTQPRVAREAGIRASHLTYYYPRKADLLGAVLDASHQRARAEAEVFGEPIDRLLGAPERMRVFLASVVDASTEPALAATVRAHMDRFEEAIARSYRRAPGDAAVVGFVDELRGAGIRMLLEEPRKLDVAARARRHGLGGGRAIGVKRFDDAAGYADEITQVLPGHELVRSVALAALREGAAPEGELLVSGCGPGDELVAAANTFPSWRIDGVEPSAPLRAVARARVVAAGLRERVRVHAKAPRRTWDAGLSLFVAHLLAGDAWRSYWEALGCAIRPRGRLLIAEIEQVGALELRVWIEWARANGITGERLGELERRVGKAFPTKPFAKTQCVAEAVGFEGGAVLLQTLGVTLRSWTRRP